MKRVKKMSPQYYALLIRQSYPLEMLEYFSDRRIIQWYEAKEGQVYISFSGGKDSTVLLDKVRRLFPEVPAVFVDTGLEYPEIRDFVKTINNVTWMRPKISFKEVLKIHGFPILSKEISMGFDRYRKTSDPIQKSLRINGGINPTSGRKQERTIPLKWQYLLDSGYMFSERCCDVLKKEPFRRYEKETGCHAYEGTMIVESKGRMKAYLKAGGCNSFNKKGRSKPLSFWSEARIWEYLHKYDLPYSKIYDMGEDRTGCLFCLFGIQYEQRPNRFDRMSENHPKHYKACMDGLGIREVLQLLDIPTDPYLNRVRRKRKEGLFY